MVEIFVSYRRLDAGYAPELLRSELEQIFGRGTIFYDRVSIRGAEHWSDAIYKAIEASQVVLVLIGADWGTIALNEQGRLDSPKDVVRRGWRPTLGRRKPALNEQRRLDDPGDVVRLEVEAALRLGKQVLPILLDGAKMPQDLPGEFLPQLAARQALPLDFANAQGHLLNIRAIVLSLLAEGSQARAHADFHNTTAEQQFVIQYDLTGLNMAREDETREWRGSQTFTAVEPELIVRARRFAHDCFSGLSIKLHTHTSSGGQLHIAVGEHPGQTLDAILKAAQEATKTFYPAFLRKQRFAPGDHRGIYWPVDLRIAIASGHVALAESHELVGDVMQRVPIATGTPVQLTKELLAARNAGTGEHRIVRGAVCAHIDSDVVADDRGRGIEGFEAISWDDLPNVYISHRRPLTDTHIRIPAHITGQLKDETLTADEKAKRLLQHTPPGNYSRAAELAKTAEGAIKTARLCIITGAPGTGKTMLALRLVAELMYVDGFTPSIPPIAPEAWKQLRSLSDARRVVFLDDAFGKTQLVNDRDYKRAWEHLRGEKAFLQRAPRPTAHPHHYNAGHHLGRGQGGNPRLGGDIREISRICLKRRLR